VRTYLPRQLVNILFDSYIGWTQQAVNQILEQKNRYNPPTADKSVSKIFLRNQRNQRQKRMRLLRRFAPRDDSGKQRNRRLNFL
jgi:hypothetical protein